MCDITAGLILATTAFSAYSTYQVSKAQAQQTIVNAQNNEQLADYNAQVVENVGDYESQIANINADVQKEAALDAIDRGTREAAAQRQKTTRSNAYGTAVRGSSGTEVNKGTNLDIVVQNRAYGEMNALQIMNNAEREAYGHKVNETNFRNQAAGIEYSTGLEADGIRYAGDVGVVNANASASNIKMGGIYSAAGTLINGATNIGKMYPDLFDSDASYLTRRRPEGNKAFLR